MLELIIDKNKQCETVCLVENGKLLERYKNNEETKKNNEKGCSCGPFLYEEKALGKEF